MSIFKYPQNYKAAFAGVPVSSLITRLGYMEKDYAELYSADYHIGQTVEENPDEYTPWFKILVKDLKLCG